MAANNKYKTKPDNSNSHSQGRKLEEMMENELLVS